MDLSRALADISEIHAQIAKGEIYRGYRPLPIAASGAIGVAAAWLQQPRLGTEDPVGFVVYWLAVAVLAGSIGASEIVFNYVVHDRAAERRQTRRVVGQFLPAMLAGAIVTAGFVRLSAALVPLLPAIWAFCFGLGTFASRPYLPRASVFVALFYYAAGIVLLWIAQAETLNGWWVGLPFGAGQALASITLAASRDGLPKTGSGFLTRTDEQEEES